MDFNQSPSYKEVVAYAQEQAAVVYGTDPFQKIQTIIAMSEEERANSKLFAEMNEANTNLRKIEAYIKNAYEKGHFTTEQCAFIYALCGGAQIIPPGEPNIRMV